MRPDATFLAESAHVGFGEVSTKLWSCTGRFECLADIRADSVMEKHFSRSTREISLGGS